MTSSDDIFYAGPRRPGEESQVPKFVAFSFVSVIITSVKRHGTTPCDTVSSFGRQLGFVNPDTLKFWG